MCVFVCAGLLSVWGEVQWHCSPMFSRTGCCWACFQSVTRSNRSSTRQLQPGHVQNNHTHTWQGLTKVIHRLQTDTERERAGWRVRLLLGKETGDAVVSLLVLYFQNWTSTKMELVNSGTPTLTRWKMAEDDRITAMIQEVTKSFVFSLERPNPGSKMAILTSEVFTTSQFS